jgi:hypothetical protein
MLSAMSIFCLHRHKDVQILVSQAKMNAIYLISAKLDAAAAVTTRLIFIKDPVSLCPVAGEWR